jgi:tRNA threonylcarbamoyladenosine biosynthesis protein TsaB
MATSSALILHLETTTLNCAVALFKGDKVLASRSHIEEGYSHAENILPFIDEVLKESGSQRADLSAVSVSSGPGSFTGLRIGVATAKGICHALNIPLIAVDTLAILALAGKSQHPGMDAYLPMLDARRMEVYTRTFTPSTCDIGITAVSPVEALIVDTDTHSRFSEFSSICFIGDGALKTHSLLAGGGRIFISDYPSATAALPLSMSAFESGKFEDIASYEPHYLKAFQAGVAKDPLGLRDKL